MSLQFSRKQRKSIVGFVKKYVVLWYSITALLYFLMIPLTIWVFPSTTLLLTIVVLFGSFTAAVASLATVLVDQEKDEEMKELNDK